MPLVEPSFEESEPQIDLNECQLIMDTDRKSLAKDDVNLIQDEKKPITSQPAKVVEDNRTNLEKMDEEDLAILLD